MSTHVAPFHVYVQNKSHGVVVVLVVVLEVVELVVVDDELLDDELLDELEVVGGIVLISHPRQSR